MKKSNCMLAFCFVIAVILPVVVWIGIPGVDNLFMYAHGEDMLKNGLVRSTDIFSMHEGLGFYYQKWIFCFATYGIVHAFGWQGLVIASYILCSIFLGSLFLFGYKYAPNHILPITAVVLTVGFLLEANGQLQFRPHVFAGILFVWMFFVIEEYARGKISSDWKFYLFFVSISVVLMWTHSTMWILYVVVFLPYICNWNFVNNFLSGRFFILENRKYKICPLLISMGLMFVAGLCNPNGFSQYKYMFVCMTATGESYRYVEELRPISLSSYMPVALFFSLIIFVVFNNCYKRESVLYLPSVYLMFGSLLLPLFAWRLVFHSALFVVVATSLQLSHIEDTSLKLDRYILPLFIGVLSIACLAAGYSLKSGQSVKTKEAYAIGVKDFIVKDAIDWVCENGRSDATIFTTTAHVGSYGIYRGLHPFVDARQEVYDISLNGKKDLLGELNDFFENKYHGTDLDAGGIYLVNEEYHPDYYVLTSYSGGDRNLQHALDNCGAECVFFEESELDPGYYVWVYVLP